MIKDKLERLKAHLEKPVKLSEIEKEKIKKVFKGIQDIFLDTEKDVLSMDRDDAYRYVNLLASKIQEADALFMGGAKAPGPTISPRQIAPQTQQIQPMAAEQFQGILNALTPEEREKAKTQLACVKDFENPDIGTEVVCRDCSLERIRECIKIDDPSIDPRDELRREIEEANKENATREKDN